MRVCLLGAFALLAGCHPRPAPLAVPPVLFVPPSAPRSSAVAPLPPPASSPEVEPSAAAPVPVGSLPEVVATAEPPRVLLEPPYSALGHPRLGTEMQTLGRDEELFQWALGGSSDPGHPSNRPGYHPATRVVVDVELMSRAPKGTTKRLERIARSTGYWPLRGCFETAQRITPKSDRAARVRLTLSANGRVLGARNVDKVSERDYARCVLERVRGLDFTPGFTRKLDVDIKVKQWPGHAPIPPRAPDNTPRVALSNEASATLQGLTPALSDCYGAGLRQDPKLWGRVALRLSLAGDGTVTQATAVETRFPNAEVTECARQTVLGARLPEASGAAKELTFAVRFGQVPVAPPTAGAPASPVDGSPPAPAPADGTLPSPPAPAPAVPSVH